MRHQKLRSAKRDGKINSIYMIVIKKIDKLSFFGCFFDALYLLSKVIGVQMLVLGFNLEWKNLITAKKTS